MLCVSASKKMLALHQMLFSECPGGYLMLNSNRTPSMPTPNIQVDRNECRKISATDSIEIGDAMVILDLYHLPDCEGCVEMLMCFDINRRVSR
jgi:hypothetical protein